MSGTEQEVRERYATEILKRPEYKTLMPILARYRDEVLREPPDPNEKCPCCATRHEASK